MRLRIPFAATAALSLLSAAPAPSDEKILSAMREELARASTDLRLPNAGPPYYVGYWVVDSTERDVEGTLGALVSDVTEKRRFVRAEVRVGSPSFDNSNFAGGGTSVDGDFVEDTALLAPREAPVDDDPLNIRRSLWLSTDAAYKKAVETLEQKRAARQSEVAPRVEVPDFSDVRSSTVVVRDEPDGATQDPAELVKRVSSVFRSFPAVQKSTVHVLEARVKRRFVSSDHGLVVEPARFSAMEITCATQADDGMAVERSAFVGAKPTGEIPADQALADARRAARELGELREAEVAEDHGGPVLFEGKAAAQLVYELLGESLSGTPPPKGNDDLESPLAHKLGKHVLPPGFTVFDDPGLTAYEGLPLVGHYAADDEGIAAERVSLVEDGRLRAFLMSRAPREGIGRSNGHGRSGLVGWARGRPGNLVLTAKGGLSEKKLEERLLDAVKEQNAGYGLVVTELEPRTSASNGDAMPAPELAYRLTPDGERTLLRGATFASISVRELRNVLAAGRELAVYSFVAESDGGLDTPVSVVSPALLFEDLDVRATTAPNKRPPVVPRPTVEGAAHFRHEAVRFAEPRVVPWLENQTTREVLPARSGIAVLAKVQGFASRQQRAPME
jgi:predicted Zn-dependent protease